MRRETDRPGAVQDLDRGLVVGINTFGLGPRAEPDEPDAGQALLTIAHRRAVAASSATTRSSATRGITRGRVPRGRAFRTRGAAGAPEVQDLTGRIVRRRRYLSRRRHQGPAEPHASRRSSSSRRVGFEFATHQDDQAPEREIGRRSSDARFTLTPDDWKNLRTIVDSKKIVMNDSVWTEASSSSAVRAELASATLGSLDRYRIAVEDDPQLNAALGTVSRAAAARGWAAGRHS